MVFSQSQYLQSDIHSSIFSTRLIRRSGRGGAKTYPSGHEAVGRWEEAGVPGENPRIHGENIQTPHRKAPCGDRIWNPLTVRRQC